MDIVVRNYQYSGETVSKWKAVWCSICDMCYSKTGIQEELILTPGRIQLDEERMLIADESEHCKFYELRYCINDEDLLLDTVWKDYSQKAGPGFVPHVVPEFKRLHVPAHLVSTLGIDAWFRECFPNCKITFWGH